MNKTNVSATGVLFLCVYVYYVEIYPFTLSHFDVDYAIPSDNGRYNLDSMHVYTERSLGQCNRTNDHNSSGGAYFKITLTDIADTVRSSRMLLFLK